MAPKKPKIPVILYEEALPGQPENPIPYIEVGKNEEMPKILFISEYKETGEFEVDPEHGAAPIVDMLIHSFVQLDFLKAKLSPERYDEVRIALGFQPLKKAMQKGNQTIKKAQKAAEERKEKLLVDKEERGKRAFALGEDLRRKSEEFLKNQKKEEEN